MRNVCKQKWRISMFTTDTLWKETHFTVLVIISEVNLSIMLDLEVVPERSLGNEQWEFVLGES